MKVNRGRLLCSKVFLSSISNVNLCVCPFFCSVFKDLYIDLFCIPFLRASVPLSLFYLSVLVSCSEFVVLFYIRFQVLVLFEFWFCSSVHDLFRSWFSVSFFLFCSVSLMKVMMGLRMRLNLMSRSRRAGHADLKC